MITEPKRTAVIMATFRGLGHRRAGLEWRLDPTSDTLIGGERQSCLVVVCRHEFSSSIPATSPRPIGLTATDMDGGVQTCVDADLPIDIGPTNVRP